MKTCWNCIHGKVEASLDWSEWHVECGLGNWAKLDPGREVPSAQMAVIAPVYLKCQDWECADMDCEHREPPK